jgi:uncharacterized protein
MEKRINDMIAAYRKGDGEAIAKITLDEFGDSAAGLRSRKRVFDDRHESMAETIEGFFAKKENHFVVIGVGHMFGPNNLLQALEKRGVKVSAVKPEAAPAAAEPAKSATPTKADAPK